MTARECCEEAIAAGSSYQRVVNGFIDEFRRATAGERARAVVDAIDSSGPLEGLVAAVVSALCRETATATPSWVARVGFQQRERPASDRETRQRRQCLLDPLPLPAPGRLGRAVGSRSLCYTVPCVPSVPSGTRKGSP